MKKLLIIGGSKFIGKSFIRYLNNNNKKINLIIISRKKIILIYYLIIVIKKSIYMGIWIFCEKY